ncbi:hypothetical protein GCM10017778_15880 [Streptomyces vinaceus]|nr:hypothetical protein GCM10017778_15880 [Streptomyces vinaceus]
MEASVSGVRHACICHHSVKAAIQNRANEIPNMTTEVYKTSPTDMPRHPAAIGKPPRGSRRAPRPARPCFPQLPLLPPRAHPPVHPLGGSP